MYVTRPLSLYRNNSVSMQTEPEGPNTGFLVIEDEAAERRWLCGLLKAKSVKAPPFPQNKLLELRYTTSGGHYQNITYLYAMLIPVLNKPLSSNQYYIIKSRGRRKGRAYTSSVDDGTGCCCFYIPDTPPQHFDPTNPYQQFRISNYIHCWSPHGFVSKSMAPSGLPPYFLRHKGWRAYTKTLHNFQPIEALGLNPALRARLPELESLDPVVVGRWYCPFIFIREGDVGSQMSNSPYYKMTLEQQWKEIFRSHKLDGDLVEVDVSVKRREVLVGELAAERVVDGEGVMWFGVGPSEVGLSVAIVERVRWEEERGGFNWGQNEEQERVARREEFEGEGEWNRFGCYVLVERFVLKRMDESLVLTWEFRHTQQIRTKWE